MIIVGIDTREEVFSVSDPEKVSKLFLILRSKIYALGNVLNGVIHTLETEKQFGRTGPVLSIAQAERLRTNWLNIEDDLTRVKTVFHYCSPSSEWQASKDEIFSLTDSAMVEELARRLKSKVEVIKNILDGIVETLRSYQQVGQPSKRVFSEAQVERFLENFPDIKGDMQRLEMVFSYNGPKNSRKLALSFPKTRSV
jgi:hypothetical protein